MEENHRDLTENLPHEILQLILSFLPVKEAIKTSVLSTAWSNVWKPLLVNLEADGGSSDCQEITSRGLSDAMKQVIAAFLGNHDAPRKLKISVGHQIVLVATKGCGHRDFHLDFYRHHDDDRKAIAACAGSNDSGSVNTIFPAEIIPMDSFLSLKTLHLRSVTAGLAENFVSALLPSCWFLESLKFEKCGGLRRIDIVVSCSSSLCMLEFSDCRDVDSMVVSAPNLRTMYYAGTLPTTIQLQGTPGLVDVKFDVGYGAGQNQFDCEQLIHFLASLSETEFLTISGWIIEWMCSAGVIFGSLDFKLSKLKKLWCTHSAIDARKRDSFACFLNLAPLLEMLFIEIDQKCISVPPPSFHQYWHEPHLWKDYTTVKSESSHLACLKVIKIVGFSNSNSEHMDHEELMFMDLLLHKALNLKAMIVAPSEDNDAWYVSKIPSSQISSWQKNNPKGRVVSSGEEHSLFVITKMYDHGNVFDLLARCGNGTSL